MSMYGEQNAFPNSIGGYAPLDSNLKILSANLPSSILGDLSYQGIWDANGNSPAIPSASSTNKGYYYVVGTSGATSISGITDWVIGDWLVSNGTTWDKIDNTENNTGLATLTSNTFTGNQTVSNSAIVLTGTGLSNFPGGASDSGFWRTTNLDLNITSGTNKSVTFQISGYNVLTFDGLNHYVSTGYFSWLFDVPLIMRSNFNQYFPSGIFNISTTSIGNATTSETDLFNISVPTILATDKTSIDFIVAGQFGATVNSKRLRVYFGATTLLDTGALAITSANDWVIYTTIIRLTSTTQVAIVEVATSSSVLVAVTKVTFPTETLSGAVTFRVTGTATANNDIVGKFSRGTFNPAA